MRAATSRARGEPLVGRPLRVAMISYYLPSASKIGVGYWVDQLARAMVARGHDVTVISASPAIEGAPYRTTTLDVSPPGRIFRFAVALRRVDLAPFDVVHAHGDDYLLPRRSGPPRVRTLHGSCFSEAVHAEGAKERLRMFLLGCTELAASLRAGKVVSVSPATWRFAPWVRETVPPGVDLDRFADRESRDGAIGAARPDGVVREADPTILFVGTYGRRKRGHLVVDAFERSVRPAFPSSRLWMVAEDCPPAPGVEVLGRISDDELASRYRRAWVFCLPSSYEGFGIPYVEAMAAGLPVVATPNPGSRFVTEEGRAGRLCRSGDLGETLVDLLGNEPERRRLSEIGRRRSSSFGLAEVAERYEQIYHGLLGAPRGGRWHARARGAAPRGGPSGR